MNVYNISELTGDEAAQLIGSRNGRICVRIYRRADGTLTDEIASYKVVSRMVREIFGPEPVREFGPRKLTSVRSAMIARGWCRTGPDEEHGFVRRRALSSRRPRSHTHVISAVADTAGAKRRRRVARREIGQIAQTRRRSCLDEVRGWRTSAAWADQTSVTADPLDVATRPDAGFGTAPHAPPTTTTVSFDGALTPAPFFDRTLT